MKKILICGGAGYIGGACTDILLKMEDVSFLVYDSLVYERDFRKNAPFEFGDVRNTDKLGALIKSYEPDAIIWLAAMVGDECCKVNPELTLGVNQDSVRWLAANYDGRIVYTSTCSVYGKADGILGEHIRPNPLSLYAITKLECERILKNKNAVCFRLGTLHGVSDRYSRIRLDLVVNILSMKAAKGDSLTVFGGEQWRPLLHVRDAAAALIHAALGKLPAGIYNIAQKNMTIKEIAAEIVAASKRLKLATPTVAYSNISFEDARNYRADCSKYENAGGIKFELTVVDGAEEIMQLVQDGRIKDPANTVFHNAKYVKEVDENGLLK